MQRQIQLQPLRTIATNPASMRPRGLRGRLRRLVPSAKSICTVAGSTKGLSLSNERLRGLRLPGERKPPNLFLIRRVRRPAEHIARNSIGLLASRAFDMYAEPTRRQRWNG